MTDLLLMDIFGGLGVLPGRNEARLSLLWLELSFNSCDWNAKCIILIVWIL